MKVLAIFALLLLPVHATPNKNQRTNQSQNNSSGKRSPTSTYVSNESTYREYDEGKDKTPPPWTNPEWWLCGVGVIGIFTAIGTLRKIERQTKATEKSLIFQFRPKIIIRGGGVVMQDADSGVIEFAIVNIGSHKAHIVGINLSAKLIESVSTESFLSSAFPINKDELKPGEGTFQTFKLDRTTSNAVHWINQQQKGVNHNKAVVFGGYINYRDDAGTLRNTGIFREYDPTKLRFIAKDDPDLEYAD